MSFAGHIFDMMRRDKENREALKRMRKRGLEPSDLHTRMPDVSAEEFEQTRQVTKEFKQQEQYLFSRMKIRMLGWLVVITLLLFVFIRWFISKG